MTKEEQIAILEGIIEKQMEDIAIHREIEKRLFILAMRPIAEHCAEAAIGASETISRATVVSTSDIAWNPDIPWDYTTTDASHSIGYV